MTFNGAKAVVTGGAGFIGSHLTDDLAAQGCSVVIFDNISTGKQENVDLVLEKHDNVEFVSGSIMDLPVLEDLFEGVDYVFHQGAIPSVPRSITDPVDSHNVNVTGTLNVLMAAKKNNVRKVVYASSSSVYGDTPTLPKTEAMPLDPLSPYAVSKLSGEYYCRVFYATYGLPTACLRYFNVFGPRQDPESQYAAVIPKFIVSMLHDQPPVVFGDGEQTRDFSFVKDVTQANMLAAESDAVGFFNIAGGNQTSINELIATIGDLLGKKDLKPVYEAVRSGDILHSFADISKAETFGFKPGYTLETGLKQTIEYYTQKYSG